jgi:putative DNA primase/helicase
MMSKRTDLLLECALYYAGRGWPVLPLHWITPEHRCDCGHPNDERGHSPGKHPLTEHGKDDASTDADQIKKWWERWPEANIGIRSGRESGLVVLDVDPRHEGHETIKKYNVPQTLTVRTGGGGKHFYFSYPAGRSIGSGNEKLGPGLDIKANGGYVVAVPSNHLQGMYHWDPVGPSHEHDVPIAECPSWILALDKGPYCGASRPSTGLPADENTQTIARECLRLLSPERADNYDGWIQTGMICRQVGLSCDEWDQWSQQSTKYEAGEPERKWDTFATTRQGTVGVGSLIFWAAQDQGISTGELLSRISPSFHLTDAGNAERFAMENAHCLRYVRDWGKWLYFDGSRWNAQTGGDRATQLAIAMARSMLVQAGRIRETESPQKLVKWALQSESAARVQAMFSLAEKLPPLVIASSDLDRDPYLLNVTNGTIDLRHGTLRPHNPADMLTKISPIEYDPGARLKVWEDHLLRVTGGDRNLIEFIQTAAGYSATGDISEEVLFLIHGPTAGGKTTTVEALRAALGDYAQTTDFETFLKRNQVGGIRNDIARLAGARLVVSVEVDEGKQLAEGLVKMLTGGDTVSARFLHHEFFEFRPQCKLWLICNDAPRASDTDDALWRRIIRVPFEHSIPKDERDPQVKAVLKDPIIGGPAVLAWIVQGCARWKSTGLIVPYAIEQATQAYRDSQDPLKEFFDERCIFESDAKIPVKDLRAAYESYAQESGIRYPLGPKEFNKRLEARECRRTTTEWKNSNGTIFEKVKCWIGVALGTATDKETAPEADSTQFDEEAPF